MSAKRMIRDWTDSETMNKLNPGAEVFFVRLIMKADDHGCFHGHLKLLKANLYPLKETTLTEINQWVTECLDAGLLQQYYADGKVYLRIVNFGQRMRSMRSRFPQPDDKLRTIVSGLPTTDDKKRPEGEVEVEGEVEGEGEARPLLEKNFNWYCDQFDELYLDQLEFAHKGKDVLQAMRESFAHLGADLVRLRTADASDCKKLLNTWLSKTKSNERNKQKNDLKSNFIDLAKGSV